MSRSSMIDFKLKTSISIIIYIQMTTMTCITCNLDLDPNHFYSFLKPSGSRYTMKHCKSCANQRRAQNHRLSHPRKQYHKVERTLRQAQLTTLNADLLQQAMTKKAIASKYNLQPADIYSYCRLRDIQQQV